MIFQGLFAVKLSVLPFIGAKIESFMCFFREKWPHVKITPKLHMVEQHVVDFIAKWGAAFGYYGEQVESNILFNKTKHQAIGIYSEGTSPTSKSRGKGSLI